MWGPKAFSIRSALPKQLFGLDYISPDERPKKSRSLSIGELLQKHFDRATALCPSGSTNASTVWDDSQSVLGGMTGRTPKTKKCDRRLPSVLTILFTFISYPIRMTPAAIFLL